MSKSKVYPILFLYYLSVASNNATGSAIMGYEYVQEADAWLRLHRVPANWRDAHMRCRLEGGVLASPTSSVLTKAMMTMMASHQLSMRQVFTGIQAIVAKGHFMSIDGTPLQNLSLRWADDEPNNANNDEDCVVMSGLGEVADVSCDSVHPFFCAKKSSKMTLNKCGTTDNGETLSEAGFAKWSKNEPNNAFGNEFCGSIVRDGLLNDFECNCTAVFICEITLT